MILCVCPNPSIDKFIHIDDFSIGKVNRTNKEFSYPVGKGVHVAIGIRELGEQVCLLAFWGGPVGQWVKQECESKGIVCYGPEISDWSRTCLTIQSKNRSNETEFLGMGPIIDALEYAAFLEDYDKLLKKSSLVSLSGSWPKNSFGANYSQLIEKASQLHLKSFIDCSGNILIDALIKTPYAVHINQHYGYDIFKSTDPEAIAIRLGESCNLSAITYGESGPYLYDFNEMVHALSKVENVISAVGSGDSLMAGLIVAHKRNYNLIKTAKLAAATGAANCIRKELGMFYKNDVEQLLKNCEMNIKIIK
ncbi:1-phosphofructokinase family hexose kinase [Wocania ichthyoenteri]|uniref:1-phosphofructokinase family hexose kinase n=1 Tax=Wocania ichthyoenteri TaxID=1230531 RepID=UPI00053E56A3|nr:PfkB family carbohydrate kinase [Wocania ichthyoenteri]